MPPPIAATPLSNEGRGGGKIDARAGDGVKQQGREQHEIDQLLQAAPEVVAQVHHPAQAEAEQDEGEIG